MPSGNRFGHQRYDAAPSHESWQLLTAPPAPATDSPEFDDQVMEAGRSFRAGNVAAIYLVHGTFAGDDALGFIRNLSRVFPKSADALRQLHKQAFDKLLNDTGNYAPRYAERFGHLSGLPVRVFRWSSENHHFARAEAAVRLLGELNKLELRAQDRVLLWGHSHAGNVFALLTNLLAADAADRDRFFRACRGHARASASPVSDSSDWARARAWLDQADRPRLLLDFVTFGTPIRYGWDAGGYERLLHFVHHRPGEGHPPYRAALPRNMDEALSAAGGDYIQHLGIAGTNLTPNVFAWSNWQAEARLGRLLQSGIRRVDLLKRLKAGKRISDDGETLLVDYGPMERTVVEHLLGHAIYTRLPWLPFHAQEVAKRFYRTG